MVDRGRSRDGSGGGSGNGGSARGRCLAQGPRPLADLLKGLLKTEKALGGASVEAVQALWRRVAGEGLAAETQAVSLRGGVLTVEVASAALLAELETFRKGELIAGLRADPDGALRGVRELRLRARRGG
jgi:predicted nucleic acid-binding Zn ribbon protein